MAGSRSRTDRYRVLERPVDEILDDLEMTDDEKKVARDQLRLSVKMATQLLKALKQDSVPEDIFPYLTKSEAIEMLESISLAISQNGIPMISFKKHPYYAKYSGDRDYQSVEILDINQIDELLQKIAESENIPVRETLEQEEYTNFVSSLADLISPSIGGNVDPKDTERLYDLAISLGVDYAVLDLYADNPIALLIRSFYGGQGKHDGQDHLSTGRGFDRNGEWAAGLARMNEMRRQLEGARELFSYLINNPKTTKTKDELIEEFGVSERTFTAILRRFMASDKNNPSTLFNPTDEEIMSAVVHDFAFSNLSAFLGMQINKWVESSINDLGIDDPDLLKEAKAPIQEEAERLRSGLRGMNTETLMRTFGTLDEFLDFIDPRDEDGQYINGSKSTTKQIKSINKINNADIEQIVDEIPNHHIDGSKSRTDSYPVIGRDIEKIFTDLELTDAEKAIASNQLMGDIKRVEALLRLLKDPNIEMDTPGISREEAIQMFESISLSISPNGTPMISFMPHPVLSRFVPPGRDYGGVLVPGIEVWESFLDEIDNRTSFMSPDEDFFPSGENESKIAMSTLPTVRIKKYLETMQEAFPIEGGESLSAEETRKIRSENALKSKNMGLILDYAPEIGNIFSTDSVISMIITSILYPEAGTLGIHDSTEHLAVGRGFDRHGEWAAALGLFDSIDPGPDATEGEKNAHAAAILSYLPNVIGLVLTELDTEFTKAFGPYDAEESSPERRDRKILARRRIRDVFDRLRQLTSESNKPSRGYVSAAFTGEELLRYFSPPRDEESSIVGSKSTTGRSTPMRDFSAEQIDAISAETARHHLNGSGAPSGPIELIGQEAAFDLDRTDLTPEQKKILSDALPESLDTIRSVINMLERGEVPEWTHPGLSTEQALKMLKSFKVSISSNGIPMITFDPHPLYSTGIPMDRNWSKVEAPSVDQIRAMIEKLREFGDRDPDDDSHEWALSFWKYASGARLGFNYGSLFDELFPAGGLLTEDGKSNAVSPIAIFLTGKIEWQIPQNILDMVLARMFDPMFNTHDVFEHLATGRSFDRHGEWAAMVGAARRVYHNPDISEKDKKRMLIDLLFSRTRLLNLQVDTASKSDLPDSDLEDIREEIDDGDLFFDSPSLYARVSSSELIELIDPSDENGRPINGSKSKTSRTIPLNASSDSLLSDVVAETAPHHVLRARGVNLRPEGERQKNEDEASLEKTTADFELNAAQRDIAAQQSEERSRRRGEIVVQDPINNLARPFPRSPFKRLIAEMSAKQNRTDSSVSGSRSQTSSRIASVAARTMSDVGRGRGDLVIERIKDLIRARKNVEDQLRYLESKLSDIDDEMFEENDARHSQLEDIGEGIDAEIREITKSLGLMIENHRTADIARQASSLAKKIIGLEMTGNRSRISEQFNFTDDEMGNILEMLNVDTRALREMLILAPSTKSLLDTVYQINNLISDVGYYVTIDDNFIDLDEDNDEISNLAQDLISHAVSIAARKKGLDSIARTVLDVESRPDDDMVDSPIEIGPGSKSRTSRTDIEKYLANDLTGEDTIETIVERFNISPQELQNIVLRMGGLPKLRRNRGIKIGNRGQQRLTGTSELENYLLEGLSSDDTASSLAKRFNMPVGRARSIINRMGGISKLRSDRGIVPNSNRTADEGIQKLEQHLTSSLRDTDTIESLASEFGVTFGGAIYLVNKLGGLRKLRNRTRLNSGVSESTASRPSGPQTSALRERLTTSLREEDTIASLADEFGLSENLVKYESEKLGGLRSLRAASGAKASGRKVNRAQGAEQDLADHVQNNLRDTDTMASLSREFDLPLDVVRSVTDGLGGLRRLRSTKGNEVNSGSKSQTRIGKVSNKPIEVLDSLEFAQLSQWYPNEGGVPDPTRDATSQYSLPVYDVDGKRIAFGTKGLGRFDPDFVDEDVEIIPVNPYLITGHGADSSLGQSYARIFFDAMQGQGIESDGTNKNLGLVAALLYSASRGDVEAMQELERLASVAREKMIQERKKEKLNLLSFMGDDPQDFNWKYDGADYLVNAGSAANGEAIFRPAGIDDLFLVHQTSYQPTFDEGGNIVLRPVSEYSPIDRNTGKPMIDPITGRLVDVVQRETIHFALNHLAQPHEMRTVDGDTYVIIVPLRDVLDANPGSLDNLYAVDTYLTPKPGEPLVIPMKSGKVVNLAADNSNSSDVVKALGDVGRQHNGSDTYETRIFPGGRHYSADAVDRRVAYLAKVEVPENYPEYEGGVSVGIHQGQPNWFIENAVPHSAVDYRSAMMTPPYWWRLSPNFILRMFDSDVFTTGSLIEMFKERVLRVL